MLVTMSEEVDDDLGLIPGAAPPTKEEAVSPAAAPLSDRRPFSAPARSPVAGRMQRQTSGGTPSSPLVRRPFVSPRSAGAAGEPDQALVPVSPGPSDAATFAADTGTHPVEEEWVVASQPNVKARTERLLSMASIGALMQLVRFCPLVRLPAATRFPPPLLSKPGAQHCVFSGASGAFDTCHHS
jgi:hypothetical protein